MKQDEPQNLTSPPPEGYRAAIVTSITVFLGFSLYFLRWWGLENKDPWSREGIVAAVILGLGIAAQLFALFRSLRIADNNGKSYSITVLCFLGSVVITIAGVIAAIIVAA
jgi:hypothetical protein